MIWGGDACILMAGVRHHHQASRFPFWLLLRPCGFYGFGASAFCRLCHLYSSRCYFSRAPESATRANKRIEKKKRWREKKGCSRDEQWGHNYLLLLILLLLLLLRSLFHYIKLNCVQPLGDDDGRRRAALAEAINWTHRVKWSRRGWAELIFSPYSPFS